MSEGLLLSCVVALLLLLCRFIFSFVTLLPQRHCHYHWWSWAGPVECLSGTHLALGRLLTAFHRSHPCSSPLQKPCHTNPKKQQRNGIFNARITGDCDDSCIDPGSIPPMLRLLNWISKEKWKKWYPIQLPISKNKQCFWDTKLQA